MIRIVQKRNVLAMVLAVILAVLTIAPVSSAQRRHYHRGPSKTKHIAVGTAIGAVGGALIGGKKGALIGAGAGAGTGYLVYRHKKRHARRY